MFGEKIGRKGFSRRRYTKQDAINAGAFILSADSSVDSSIGINITNRTGLTVSDISFIFIKRMYSNITLDFHDPGGIFVQNYTWGAAESIIAESAPQNEGVQNWIKTSGAIFIKNNSIGAEAVFKARGFLDRGASYVVPGDFFSKITIWVFPK